MKNLILLLSYWVYLDFRDLAGTIKKMYYKRWKRQQGTIA